MRAVLDASALLAYLRREPGTPLVREALQQGCAISAANWAEVLSKVAEGGEDSGQTVELFERGGVLGQSLVVHPLNDAQALEIARWWWFNVEWHPHRNDAGRASGRPRASRRTWRTKASF